MNDAAEASESAEIKRPSSTTRVEVVSIDDEARSRRPDSLATEEPMEIRVDQPGGEQRNVAVTMRTPGHDFALAVGFLFTEGLITAQADVKSIRYCSVARDEQHYNVVSVSVTRKLELETQRNFYATSSCGICGKASLDLIDVQCAPIPDGPLVQAATITGLPHELRRAQSLFDLTGGLHAAALFGPTGRLISSHEDVGRHNALDKLIGSELLAGHLPLSESVLLVSGRASFEIIQKAATAGIPIVCAVSAPSSLAVDAARRFGLTLIGFLREQRFNIYTRADRIGDD